LWRETVPSGIKSYDKIITDVCIEFEEEHEDWSR
jgi:hypothetical protein